MIIFYIQCCINNTNKACPLNGKLVHMLLLEYKSYHLCKFKNSVCVLELSQLLSNTKICETCKSQFAISYMELHVHPVNTSTTLF